MKGNQKLATWQPYNPKSLHMKGAPPLPPSLQEGLPCNFTVPEHVAMAQILHPCYIWELKHYHSWLLESRSL